MAVESNDLTIRDLSSSGIWDFENAFYWFSHPSRLNKLIAHFELYKSIIGLPGDVVELGVYKAASLMRLATFRNLLENDFSRKIVGFDAFGKFPTDQLSLGSDLTFIDKFEEAGGEGLSIAEVQSVIARKGFQNIHLVKGNIFQTLSRYLDENPALRISFLHLDMDVKEPTLFALNLLYERVVPNGLIVFDDYAAVAGASDAVDEFVAKRERTSLEKTNFSYAPSYIRKRQ